MSITDLGVVHISIDADDVQPVMSIIDSFCDQIENLISRYETVAIHQ